MGDFKDEGFLPDAMLNFLALLGWNDGSEQEIYSRQELIEKFSLDRITKSGAVFDKTKLAWMNGTSPDRRPSDRLGVSHSRSGTQSMEAASPASAHYLTLWSPSSQAPV